MVEFVWTKIKLLYGIWPGLRGGLRIPLNINHELYGNAPLMSMYKFAYVFVTLAVLKIRLNIVCLPKSESEPQCYTCVHVTIHVSFYFATYIGNYSHL